MEKGKGNEKECRQWMISTPNKTHERRQTARHSSNNNNNNINNNNNNNNNQIGVCMHANNRGTK